MQTHSDDLRFFVAVVENGGFTRAAAVLETDNSTLSRRVKRILQLPRGAEINMIVSCGVREGDRGVWGERFRLPLGIAKAA